MRYVTRDEIASLGITPETCVEWVREAFLMKPECTLPAKISVHPQGTDFINTMPCLLPERYHRFGCKVVSRVRGSHPAIKSETMLLDSLSGEMIALVNSDWITEKRTGAVAALAINTLRNSRARIYSFVGLGVTGNAAIECLLATNRNRPMTIRLKRYKDHAERTAARFSGYGNAAFEFADSMDELVDGADVVVSCITDADGLLVEDSARFKPGVLVVPVHTRGFQNCDTVFDKVFADDEGHVSGFRYFRSFRKFVELGDVLSGKVPGRESDQERILSYNIGLGLHDVLYATKILRLLDD